MIKRLLNTRSLKIVLFGTILLLGTINKASAQFYSVKTDMLGLATTTLNVEGSAVVSNQWTLHLHVQYNPWTFPDNKKMKNLTFLPGARYWFNETYSYSYFIGFNAIISRYNVGGLFGSDYRYDGMGYGGGVSFGFSKPIRRQWNLEFELGIGGVYSNYDKYPCIKCGEKIDEGSGLFLSPNKAAISLVYLF
ncbi:DUF3575 domain-containing protein [Dysgonomonas gadei]|uniref:DUF3575 domain-containing protein n=1 Tax=Dysgonomonas gadei ATCC BAA-286 TaxID=742766 RepID=F5ITD0_9BACT|nr:DUF3575 domain-containing protein [Dysgonomonas gadei]EGJ99314.1 hypothetical protein HMPREF9455_00347 [Dysgonomonas gadei ATCC BAA-286]